MTLYLFRAGDRVECDHTRSQLAERLHQSLRVLHTLNPSLVRVVTRRFNRESIEKGLKRLASDLKVRIERCQALLFRWRTEFFCHQNPAFLTDGGNAIANLHVPAFPFRFFRREFRPTVQRIRL